MMPVIVRPESMIFGNTRGSFVSSTMFTESSKPTMEKKASAVAPVTARRDALVAGGLEDHHAGEVRMPRTESEESDDDDQQQTGELDEGEEHVEPHALADTAEVDQCDEGEEGQGNPHHPCARDVPAETGHEVRGENIRRRRR